MKRQIDGVRPVVAQLKNVAQRRLIAIQESLELDANFILADQKLVIDPEIRIGELESCTEPRYGGADKYRGFCGAKFEFVTAQIAAVMIVKARSEERRVGKEC